MSGTPLPSLRSQHLLSQQQAALTGRFALQQAPVAPPAYAPQPQQVVAQAAPVMQHIASAAAPSSFSEQAHESAVAPARSANSVIVPLTGSFQFLLNPSSSVKADKKMVLSAAPLEESLRALGLNSDQNLNIESIYLRSFSNSAPHRLGVQVSGVNSADLKVHPGSESSAWSTFVMQPNEQMNFMKLNDGLGLRLAENKLSSSELAKANINIDDVKKQLGTREDYMENGLPTHYFVKANLSSFQQHVQQGEQGVHSVLNSSLNSAAKLLLSNAAPAFNLSDDIKAALGVVPLSQETIDELQSRGITIDPYQAAALPRLTVPRVRGNMFTDVDVQPDTHARMQPSFLVRVPANEMHDMIDTYTKSVSQTSLPTKASAVTISVHRPEGVAIGDMKTGVFNIKKSDLESWQDVMSGAHVELVCVVQHPGKASAEANIGGL